jgi:Zn-dependent peptidase ImmA (M78 family)
LKRLTRTQIEVSTSLLLDDYGFKRPPIDVEKLAQKLGYEVVYQHLRGDVSGTVLLDEDGHITIGINTFHGETRQRFSIAHEIGHAQLHASTLKTKPFVDPPVRVLFRDGVSSLGEDPLEIQANQFAAGLLMPRALVGQVGQRLIDRNPRITSSLLVEGLASRFNVSSQAMRYRLVTFGVLEPD